MPHDQVMPAEALAALRSIERLTHLHGALTADRCREIHALAAEALKAAEPTA